MNDLTFQILDALYFVEPYEKLKAEIPVPGAVLKDELKRLISLGWIEVKEWNEELKDYVSSPIFDSHNLEKYAFVITFEGLQQHNSYQKLS